MFDIGFAELIIIGVVGLLVIGPERLPSTIRTAQLWIRRLKGNFNEIKRELEQDLHNDEIMQQLKSTRDEFKNHTTAVNSSVDEFKSTLEKVVDYESEKSNQPPQNNDTAKKAPPEGDTGNTDSS